MMTKCRLGAHHKAIGHSVGIEPPEGCAHWLEKVRETHKVRSNFLVAGEPPNHNCKSELNGTKEEPSANMNVKCSMSQEAHTTLCLEMACEIALQRNTQLQSWLEEMCMMRTDSEHKEFHQSFHKTERGSHKSNTATEDEATVKKQAPENE